MKFNRKYLRFSLRGLLVAMTITGVALGLYLKRVQDQIRAVAMIESLGGRCWYEFQLDENRIKLPQSSEPSVICLLYTSPSPRDKRQSRMPSSA